LQRVSQTENQKVAKQSTESAGQVQVLTQKIAFLEQQNDT